MGVKLMGDNGAELCRIVALVTGASQWSNRTWERTIKGWGVMAGGKLVAECLDSSVWDGNNMHHRTTEPTCLARDWDRDTEVAAPSWMPGTETRELVAQLPAAIARYMAHCERERAENESTAVLDREWLGLFAWCRRGGCAAGASRVGILGSGSEGELSDVAARIPDRREPTH